MLTHATRFCLLVLLVLLASFATAAAQETVALGSDYFQTVAGNGDSSGTWFNFGSGIGVVDFQGVPRGGRSGTPTQSCNARLTLRLTVPQFLSNL